MGKNLIGRNAVVTACKVCSSSLATVSVYQIYTVWSNSVYSWCAHYSFLNWWVKKCWSNYLNDNVFDREWTIWQSIYMITCSYSINAMTKPIRISSASLNNAFTLAYIHYRLIKPTKSTAHYRNENESLAVVERRYASNSGIAGGKCDNATSFLIPFFLKIHELFVCRVQVI